MKEKPLTIVIFGGTGDLAQQKLVPALLDLYTADCVPREMSIVGFSRKDLSDAEYQAFMRQSLQEAGKPLNESFLQTGRYMQGDLTSVESYHALAEYLYAIDERVGTCTNKLFYLAVPPRLYDDVFSHLAKSGLVTPCREDAEDQTWTRLLVEKPFGDDRDHAIELDKKLGALFSEDQVFRIDHYLAKETLQNIVTFRFANALFEPVWNKDSIERVDIELFEESGIRSRAAFYDGIGALRDVGQNHVLQMLALILMDDPGVLEAEAIRRARAAVLKTVKPLGETVAMYATRGQYEGYRGDDGVPDDSETETFFRLKVHADTERWRGVPIHISSGKALQKTHAQIRITFKEQTSCVCKTQNHENHKNVLTFTIQPNENISIRFWAKRPGFAHELDEKKLSFEYNYSDIRLPDAYERVLYDCVRGDQTLFTSTDEVAAQWNLIMPILEAWKEIPPVLYKQGANPDSITHKV